MRELLMDSGLLHHPALLSRLLAAAVMFAILKAITRNAYIQAFIWLPATFLHELSHLVVGFSLFARPVQFSVWPSRIPGTRYFKLGHVAFANLTWWRKLPVAVAPLCLLLPLAMVFLWASLLNPETLGFNLLMCLCAVQCAKGSWPSDIDWKHAGTTILIALIAAALLAWAVLWLQKHLLA